MANIRQLPDGFAILANPQLTGRYGPKDRHLMTADVVGSANTAVSLIHIPVGAPANVLATVRLDGTADIAFGDLDALTVPYVNRFIIPTGMVVIKDWRTGNYRTKVRTGGAPKSKHTATADFAKATPFVAPTVLEEDEEEAPQAAAVITVSAESHSALANIPGVEFLPKGTLKGAGRGYTDVNGIIIETEGFEVLSDAWGLAQDGKPAAVLLTGPAGTAKTMLVRSFAGYLGIPYLKVDAGAIRTADDWAGAFRQDANTKTWAHRWSPFAQALRAGAPCIVHIDELTRTESPAALNALMGLLDETGTLLVPDANAVLRMPKGILVVATANIGPEFVGTLPIDGAVRQRFPYGYRMAPPPEANEVALLVRRTKVTKDIATRLVRMAHQQRLHRDDAQLYPSGAVISTRVLLSIAERIGSRNADPRSAVISTLHAQFDPGDDAALSVCIDSQFPKGWKPGKPGETVGEGNPIVTERHYWVNPTGAGPEGPCEWTFSDGSRCGNPSGNPVHIK